MIIPPYLQPGSTIGITCPSGYVAPERVTYAVTVLEQWGFKVVQGNTIGSAYHYFSGTDDERLADLQMMLDDPAINAIVMGRGGYGLSRIIDRIDFAGFIAHPKWITGFSDLTVLHNHVHANYEVATLHSPMCGAFSPATGHEDYLRSMLLCLTGAAVAYPIPASAHNRMGTARGVLTGGNLALLAHLTGSASEVDTRGKILFIEDLSEYLYNADRMLMNLKRAGKLEGLKGLIVGGFTEMKDTERPFGQIIEEIIMDKVREYDYPVCFNFPAGHQDVNYSLTLGAVHQLSVAAGGSKLDLVSNG